MLSFFKKMIYVFKYQIPGHHYIEKAIKVFKIKEATHLKSCMCLEKMGESTRCCQFTL